MTATTPHCGLHPHLTEAIALDCERRRLQADIDRLRKLVTWCRPRLKRDAYRNYVDRCLADPTLLDPDPEMQGKLIQSAVEQSALPEGDNDPNGNRDLAREIDG